MRLFRATAIFLFVVVTGVSAQSKAPLGESEIKGARKIEFINRSLKKANPDILQENAETGKKLASALSKSDNASISGVTVQRIQPGSDGKLGADIFSISESQSFDHVNSIVRIVAAYLENSFQYKAGGADTLAQYVLYYNAAHRKDLKFFTGKYTADVITSVTAEKVGIDTNYKNWSGKTQLIIPIEKNILKDSGKDITADELEKDVNRIVKDKEKDPATKQKMQDEAKKMDKLQDDKIKEEKKIVQDKKQEVVKEQKQVADKKEELAKKEATTVANLNELKKDPVKNKAEIEKKTEEVKQIQQEQKATEVKEAALEQKKEELVKKEEQVAAKEEARKEGDTSSTESTKTNEAVKVAEEKVQEVQKELSQVKDELKKKEEQSDNVINNKILFMKFIKYDAEGHYSNELWAIDTKKDDALFKSPYNNICSKEFKEIPNQGVLVLGYDGEKIETRKHKLVLLDPDKLGVKKSSENSDIFWRTPIVPREDKIYVVEKFQDKYYVARFKSDLTFEARSSEAIEENSELTFFGEKIYVTGKPKEGDKTTIKIFKKEDLTLVKTIAP
ncbi:P83/100 family protein [Leptospira sp. 'Mane']|uniref:P83/100 family protein n=1 Tax=Leptospira sp. 'Mane' TaxID=3387407 RepID=UPI00398BADA0